MGHEPKKAKKRAGKVVHSAVSKHAADKAGEIHRKYGPDIDYPALLRILEDRSCIRYPVHIRFVSDGIEPGLFGKTEQVTDDPSAGYLISLHESFESRPEILPALVLYQSVLVNYGDLATAVDAELFGSGVLGIDRDAYYRVIVELTDSLWQTPDPDRPTRE